MPPTATLMRTGSWFWWVPRVGGDLLLPQQLGEAFGGGRQVAPEGDVRQCEGFGGAFEGWCGLDVGAVEDAVGSPVGLVGRGLQLVHGIEDDLLQGGDALHGDPVHRRPRPSRDPPDLGHVARSLAPMR